MSLKNALDFGFSKNRQNPTTFGFELRHIPILACIKKMQMTKDNHFIYD